MIWYDNTNSISNGLIQKEGHAIRLSLFDLLCMCRKYLCDLLCILLLCQCINPLWRNRKRQALAFQYQLCDLHATGCPPFPWIGTNLMR